MTTLRPITSNSRQRGVAAVEFALLSLFVFFPLLLALIEVSRYMFLYNTIQEVKRRAAREASIRWISSADQNIIKRKAMFGRSNVPAGPEITADKISITYWNASGSEVTTAPLDAGDNMSACNDALRTLQCIYAVKVEIDDVDFQPWIAPSGLFNSDTLKITMPRSTVYMPAESLGFTN